jgi:valyl-tRNA synthetase
MINRQVDPVGHQRQVSRRTEETRTSFSSPAALRHIERRTEMNEIPTIEYDPKAIEARWQQHWTETAIYRTLTPLARNSHTFYCLDFFPYPSGDGLSIGHGDPYT